MAFDNIPDEVLKDATRNSVTFREIFRRIGFVGTGKSYKALKRRLNKSYIDYSHIPIGLDANKGRCFYFPKPIDIQKLLVENSSNANSTVRKHLLRNNLVPYICAGCGMGPTWNNKELTLRLDHKNGVRNDHRLENLRFLCPNCDSQTETYGGRNIKWNKIKYFCQKCSTEISKGSVRCSECERIRRMKCKRPPKAQLEKIVWQKPLRVIAKQFGVSDKAVAKWCKKDNIKTPGVGYWRIRECCSNPVRDTN